MLAQLQTVDPVTLKDFLLIVFAFASPLAWWAGRRKSVRVEPQPVEVRGVPGVVTRDYFDAHQVSVAREMADVKSRVTALEGGQREIVDRIDQRLAEFRSDIKEDRGAIQSQLLAEVSKVHGRIDMLLEAIAEIRTNHRPRP